LTLSQAFVSPFALSARFPIISSFFSIYRHPFLHIFFDFKIGPIVTLTPTPYSARYGKEFYERAEGNFRGCVNDRVVHKLSVSPPTAFLIQSYLSRIADE
jgi:hypothetical protein